MIYPRFHLRNDHTDSCYSRNGKSYSGSGYGFSQIFDSGSGSESERRTQNPAGVDYGNPDPVPPLLSTSRVREDHYPVCRLDIRQDSEFAPDKDIQKLLSNATGYGSGYPKRFYQYFEDSDFCKKVDIAQSFIYYLQRHLFSLLHHGSESVYGVISEP